MPIEQESRLQGYYINLRDSVARNDAMRRHLRSLGLDTVYRRFEALRGSEQPERAETTLAPGHLGCWLSHQALWERAAALPAGSAMHVLEDDAHLHREARPLLQTFCREQIDWDLLYTDVFWHPPPTPEQFQFLMDAVNAFQRHRRLTVTALAGWRFTGTTSYVVAAQGATRLLKLLSGRWREGRTVDVLIDELVGQGTLRAKVVLPFVTTLNGAHARSTTGDEGPAATALSALRRAFYLAAVPEDIRRVALGARADAGVDPRLDLYLAVVRECLRGVRVQAG